MWYFAWILGLGFAVLLAVVSAVWVEFEDSPEMLLIIQTTTKNNINIISQR